MPARDQAIELIRQSKDVFVGTHVRPDGDALGSLLGLSLALEKAGLRVARLCADPVPGVYAFLEKSDQMRAEPPEWRPQLGLVADCDGLARLGPLTSSFASLPHLVDMDHHASNQSFGQVRLIDPSAGACAEIVHDLISGLGVPLDEDIATCLYTGVLTDTGRFCYPNTTAASLRIAAELVAAGARPGFIARKVYAENSIAATHLLGVALSRLAVHLGEQVVSAALTRADFTATGAVSADTEGIIDHLRAIGGPRVALLFVQLENGEVRVSLRSDGSVDVSAIALGFRGGGHAMAAGCTCAGSVEQVQRQVLSAVEKWLSASGPAQESRSGSDHDG